MEITPSLVRWVVIAVLALGFLVWMGVRQMVREQQAEHARMRLQMAAWQRAADDRAANLKRLNDDAIKGAQACLRRSQETLDRTNAFIDACNKPRARG